MTSGMLVVIVLAAVIVGLIIYGVSLYHPAPWDDDVED